MPTKTTEKPFDDRAELLYRRAHPSELREDPAELIAAVIRWRDNEQGMSVDRSRFLDGNCRRYLDPEAHKHHGQLEFSVGDVPAAMTCTPYNAFSLEYTPIPATGSTPEQLAHSELWIREHETGVPVQLPMRKKAKEALVWLRTHFESLYLDDRVKVLRPE